MTLRRWFTVLLLVFTAGMFLPVGHSQSVFRFGSLPIDSNPGTAFFQGQDGNFYGVLRETNLPLTLEEEARESRGIGLPTTNGAIYQLTPDGNMRYLFQFPRLWNYPEENAVGAVPSSLLTMGEDGYLYGLTQNGGIHGFGVFYKLSVDGKYEVVSHMPDSIINPYYFTGFVQGPDGAFYSYATYEKRKLLRFGLDGTITEIGDEHPASYAFLLGDPYHNDRCALVWRDEYDVPYPSELQNKITVRWIELPSGRLLSEHVYNPFPSTADFVHILQITAEGVLVYTPTTDWRNSLPGKLVVLKEDGSFTSVTDFSSRTEGPDGNLPPALRSLIPCKQGGYYFTAGNQTRGILGGLGGSRLYRLNPDNSFELLCDFNGYPLISMFEAADGFLYGVSWGTGINEAPSESTDGTSSVARSPLRAEVSSRSPARTLVRSRHGAFRRKPDFGNVNLSPAAKSDSVILPRRPGSTGILIPVLQNDRDPDREPITLTEVSEATQGVVSIATNSKGKQVLNYVPSHSPSASEILSYKITDTAGQSAVGQVFIRGDVRGLYRRTKTSGEKNSAAKGASESFSVRVTPSGSFTLSFTLAGYRLSTKATLNYNDSATLYRKAKDGTRIEVKIRVGATDTAAKALAYTVSIGEQVFTGTAMP